MRMLDLFCGRFGWGKAFAARGWEVVGVDLAWPPPAGCPDIRFVQADVLGINFAADRFWHRGNGRMAPESLGSFNFICASSPCEQFSVHGMKHFHPNPPYPEMGIKLFNHTRALCEASGVPYVMENVRAAQQFVGNAVNHCGPFYLWGTGVPPLMPQGVKKGISLRIPGIETMSLEERRLARKAAGIAFQNTSSGSEARRAVTAAAATIPPELAGAVADYATRLCEVTA